MLEEQLAARLVNVTVTKSAVLQDADNTAISFVSALYNISISYNKSLLSLSLKIIGFSSSMLSLPQQGEYCVR